MTIRSISLVMAAGAVLSLSACAETQELHFVDHVKAGVIEQDAYVEKSPGSGKVYRINADEFDRFKNAPVFGTQEVVHHSPFDPGHNGPYSKGKPLGINMSDWLAASGNATYTCKGGAGSIEASFSRLVPNGIYTMWYAVAGKGHMGCKDCPFSTIDYPVGDPDGSESVFTADAQGNATYAASFKPCYMFDSERLVGMLAIAYHSDGKTYGPDPGPFGRGSHVHLFAMPPEKK